MPRLATSHAHVDPPVDYGSGFARLGARIVPLPIGASAGLELAEVPDIDRPDTRHVVRVARRVDPLRNILDIHDRNGPEGLWFLAAETLRRDAALADGVSGRGYDMQSVSGRSTGPEPTERMLDAQTRCVAAWEAVRGPENDALCADAIRCVVLGYATLGVAQARYGWKDFRRVRKLLDLGLERLASHYSLTERAATQ